MATVSNIQIPLQALGTGDAEALGLKMWAGEVVGAYHQTSVTEGRFGSKTVTGGLTSAQWIVTARTTSSYFTRGEDIFVDADADAVDYLKEVLANEVVVFIDRPDKSPHFLDRQDSILAHYDMQGEIRRQQGQRLARQRDKNRLICVARGSHRIDGGGGEEETFVTGLKPASLPTALFDADYFTAGATGIADTEAGISLMAERFDALEVPKEGRMMFVSPTNYRYLVNNLDEYISTDYRGEGSKARGEIYHIHGFEVIMTTNMPTTDLAHPAGATSGTVGNNYACDCEGVQALFATPDSIAEVRLGTGFGFESFQAPWRGGMVVNAEWSGGHSELRPEACGSMYNVAIDANANS